MAKEEYSFDISALNDLNQTLLDQRIGTPEKGPSGGGAGTFSRAVSSGAASVRANINYLDAAFQAITGDEKELDESLQEALFWEEIAGEYMQGLPTVEDFLNAPTVDGFIEQAKIATGEFAPSIVASLVAATTGAVIAGIAGVPAVTGGLLTGTATWAGARLGLTQAISGPGKKALLNIVKDSWKNKSKGLRDLKGTYDDKFRGDQLKLLEKFAGQPGWKRRTRMGGLAGAYLQEGGQGTGVTFGEFARQDMTSPREAAISAAVGFGPYAAVGITSELVAGRAIIKPLTDHITKIAKKRAAKGGADAPIYKALLSDLSKVGVQTAKGFATGAVSEGTAETLQESMTIAQQLSIDPEYDREQARMDLLTASFKGIVGGGVFAGGGRGVSSSVERIVNRTQDLLGRKERRAERKAKRARGEMEQLDLFGINPDFDSALNSKAQYKKASSAVRTISALFGGKETGRKIFGTDISIEEDLNLKPVSMPDLSFLDTKQFTKFDWTKGPNESIPESIKDIRRQISSLFETSLPKDSVYLPPNQVIPTQKELDKIYGGRKVHVGAVEGVGTLISLNKRKVDEFVANPGKESIAAALKYLRALTSGDDRGFRVRWKDGGEYVHTELTNAADQEATKQSLEALFKKGIEENLVEIEGPYSTEDIAEDTYERNNTKENKDDFTRVRTENALDRIKAAKNADEIGRVVESFWDDPLVLIEIYKNLTGGNFDQVLKSLLPLKLTLEKRIKEILVPIQKELIASLERKGEPVNDVSLLDSRVLRKYKAALQQQEEAEAEKAKKPTESLEEDIEGVAKTKAERAQEELDDTAAEVAEQQVQEEEGGFVDETEEGMSTREPNSWVEVINQNGNPWLPFNEEAAKKVEGAYQAYTDNRKALSERLQPEESADLNALESRLGVKLPQGLINRLIRLIDSHEGQTIRYTVVPQHFVEVNKTKKEDEPDIKNRIFEEEVIRQFKSEGKDRRKKAIKEEFVNAVNEIKNTHNRFNLEHVIDTYPVIAEQFGFAKNKLGFVIKYLPSPESNLIMDYSNTKRGPLPITEEEFTKRFFAAATVSGKETDADAERMRGEAFFTMLTPEGKKKAEDKAVEFREKTERESIEGIVVSEFKKAKKDRRRKDIKTEFVERVLFLEKAYDEKLQNFSRAEEKIIHMPLGFAKYGTTVNQSNMLGKFIEGDRDFRQASLLTVLALGAKYGYDFRVRPSKPSTTKEIVVSFTEPAELVKSGKKTMTSRRSKLGEKGDVFRIAKDKDAGLYRLIEEPKQKKVQEIIKEDFKAEGFNSQREAFDAFEELNYIHFDYNDFYTNMFMYGGRTGGGDRGVPLYQRFIHRLKYLEEYSEAEIEEINLGIRKTHLEGLKRSYPTLKKATIQKDNSTIKVAAGIKARLKEIFGPKFSRLLVGNHGIYVEWTENPYPKTLEKQKQPHLQYNEYRLNGVKFYEQTDTVNYADYRPGRWYANIHDTTLNKGKAVNPINIWSTDRNGYEALSNLARRPFKDKDGRNYISVEHAYQSWKSGKFDEATYKRPWKNGSKFVGKLGTKTQDNWNINLMESLMKLSFNQNPKAMELLKKTGNAPLTHTQDRGIWKNEFPRILMDIRGVKTGRTVAGTYKEPFGYSNDPLYTHKFKKLSKQEEKEYKDTDTLLPSVALVDATPEIFLQSRAAVSSNYKLGKRATFADLYGITGKLPADAIGLETIKNYREQIRALMHTIVNEQLQTGEVPLTKLDGIIWGNFQAYEDLETEVNDKFAERRKESLEETRSAIESRGKAIKPSKIISGGQTGVDFIGLNAAKKVGIETGGTAPLGYRSAATNPATHAKKLQDLGLEEAESDNYNDRTDKNIINSDGTLVFTEGDGSGITPGTGYTIRKARELGKPTLVNPQSQEKIWVWLKAHNIDTVNIAGPREISENREKQINEIIENSWGKNSDENVLNTNWEQYKPLYVEIMPDIDKLSPETIYLQPTNEFTPGETIVDSVEDYKFIIVTLQDYAEKNGYSINTQDIEMDPDTGESDPEIADSILGELSDMPTAKREAEFRAQIRLSEKLNPGSLQASSRSFIPEYVKEGLIGGLRVDQDAIGTKDTREAGKQLVSTSKAFKESMGKYSGPMLALLKKFKFFGIKANLTFLTYDDINPEWNTKRKREDALLKLLYRDGKTERVLNKLWKEKQKNKWGQRGATFKMRGDKEYIIVIDTYSARTGRPSNIRADDYAKLNKTQKDLLGSAQVMIALAHELGHVIAFNELDSLHFNKGVKEKIWKDFKAAQPLNTRYMNEEPGRVEGQTKGFEEWFADQTAAWLIKTLRDGRKTKPQNFAEGFFARLANKIKRAWTKLMEGVAADKIFAGKFVPSEAFNEFADDLAKSFKATKNLEFQRGYLGFEEKEHLFNMVEEVVEAERNNFGLAKAAWKTVRKETAKKYNEIVRNNPNGASFLAKIVQPASSFLGRMKDEDGNPVGREMANRIQRRSRTVAEKGQELGLLDAKDRKFSQFNNQLAKILELDVNRMFSRQFTEKHDKAFAYAEDERISDEKLSKLSPMGHKLRMWKRKKLYPYLQEVEFEDSPKFLETILRDRKGKEIGVASYFSRSLKVWDMANDDGLRNAFVNYVANKLREGRIKSNRGTRGEIRPDIDGLVVYEGLRAVEEGQRVTPEEWAELFVLDVLSRDPDDTFADALSKHEQDIDSKSIKLGLPNALARTMKYEISPAVDENGVEQVDENGDPIYKAYGFATSELREIGAIEEGFTATMNYLRAITKRVEYERVGGASWFESKISKLEPHQQPKAREAIRAMLGKLGTPMDPLARKINSWGIAANVFTTLTFAVLASFPDLAGPLLRSNSFNSFQNAAKEYRQYFNDKDAAVQFALDVGAITQDSLSMMYIHAAEMDYMTPNSKRLTDYFFKAIMLDQFTRFTRVFAAGMGKRFLVSTAHDVLTDKVTTDRWLKELNITRAEVLAWEKSGFDFNTPEGEKASQAIYQFVNESIIRPNAAQRPTWASNPYFALVWQLKGFFYAYGQTIVMGQHREMKNRFREQGIGGAAVPLTMMALTVLPLTIMGLELREWIKYVLAGPLPGVEMDDKYFATDNMDWGTWFAELIDRSGILGAFGILFPLLPGDHSFGGPYETGADILGPTSGKVFDLFKHGPLDSGFWKEQVPVYYTLW